VSKVFTADESWMSWDELKIRLDRLHSLQAATERASLRSELLKLAFFENQGAKVSPITDAKSPSVA